MSDLACRFCGKCVKNKQSYRAHLQFCPNYTIRPKIRVLYQHGCGALYVSAIDRPKRGCPGCDCITEVDEWERLGETDHAVGPVPDGEEVEYR